MYKNLSDTAALIKKYSFQDSVPIVGGWGFNLKKELVYQGEPQAMKDTTIGGIGYKRYRIQRKNKNLTFYSIVFLRCDGGEALFNLEENLSRKLGCLCSGIYNYSPEQSQSMLEKVNFLNSDLTQEQEKVFETWEKRANENKR